MKKRIGLFIILLLSLSIVIAASESYRFDKSSTKLKLGDKLTDIVSTDLDEAELPGILAEGVFSATFDYNQRISMGTELLYEEITDPNLNSETPTKAIKLDAGEHILTYTFEFVEEPTFAEFEGEMIFLLGEYYTITTYGTTTKKITLTKVEDNKIMILESTKEAIFDSNTLTGTETTIIENTGKITSISIKITSENEFFVWEGNDYTIPTLGTLSLNYDGTEMIGTEEIGKVNLLSNYDDTAPTNYPEEFIQQELDPPEKSESFKFEKVSSKLNLGEKLTDIIATDIGDDELPKFLEDMTFDDNYPYTQKISMSTNLLYEEFSDNDFDDGALTKGIAIQSNNNVLTYTIDFLQEPLLGNIANEEIFLLGRYYEIKGYQTTTKTLTLIDEENNELTLMSGADIELNGENIDDIQTTITENAGRLANIKIIWDAEDDSFVAIDNDFSIPYLRTLKLRYTGASTINGEQVGRIYLVGHYEEKETTTPPITGPICGDNTCDTTESCTSCSTDCGTCPTTQPTTTPPTTPPTTLTPTNNGPEENIDGSTTAPGEGSDSEKAIGKEDSEGSAMTTILVIVGATVAVFLIATIMIIIKNRGMPQPRPTMQQPFIPPTPQGYQNQQGQPPGPQTPPPGNYPIN